MRKYNLIAKVRRANPYRKVAQATQEHKTCANLLKRQFNQAEPEKVLLTDITYLKYNHGQQWGYLSCVKDGSTNEILAHYLSTSLELWLVNRTLDKLLERLNGNIHPEAILHSDQGMHYTHPEFQKHVVETGFRQSMSRRGNCYDNAPMESFFGHMKDQLEYKDCTSIDELRNRINEYIHFYNTERYQWTLKKMTLTNIGIIFWQRSAFFILSTLRVIVHLKYKEFVLLHSRYVHPKKVHTKSTISIMAWVYIH